MYITLQGQYGHICFNNIEVCIHYCCAISWQVIFGIPAERDRK